MENLGSDEKKLARQKTNEKKIICWTKKGIEATPWERVKNAVKMAKNEVSAKRTFFS